MWNHPWVLKLDEDRQLLRAERAAMFDTSESEGGYEYDDDTLGGFIVYGSDEDSSNSSSVRKVRRRHDVWGSERMGGGGGTPVIHVIMSTTDPICVDSSQTVLEHHRSFIHWTGHMYNTCSV